MIQVRPLSNEDREWATGYQAATWGGRLVARRSQLVDTSPLPALVVLSMASEPACSRQRCEGKSVKLSPCPQGQGVGRALLDAVREIAEAAGCTRLWLITTNNNLRALKLYQRWGVKLVALPPGAVLDARRA